MHSIVKDRSVFQENWKFVQMASLVPLVSDEEIEQVCLALGHRWRNRIFSPPVTVRSLLYRALNPDKSIVNTVEELTACRSLSGGFSPTAGAWCQARDRLPAQTLNCLINKSVRKMRRAFEELNLWFRRRVYIVDGTTVSMPDEPSLVKAFGLSKGKHGLSHFPVARLVAVLQAGLHIVSDYRIAHWRTAEQPLFHQMLLSIPRAAVVVTDRYYSGYVNFALVKRRGVHLLCRLHQRRDPAKLISMGKKIGANEWLVELKLSKIHKRAHPEIDLPDSIKLRLIRYVYHSKGKKEVLYLLTTLLDNKAYPRQAVIALYKKRWGIETHYNHLKTTLQMAVLRSKNPNNIRTEIASLMLAHNLVWTLIHEAARGRSGKVGKISFAGAVKVTLAFCSPLRAATSRNRRSVYRKMLREIARLLNRHPPNRHEPRLVKRDKNKYQMLRVSREEARKSA